MGTVVKDNGGDFEPLPAGMHRAICVNYFDVGMQPGYQGGPPHEKIIVLWEIEARSLAGKRFSVTKIYTKSIGEKSNLGYDLTSWRGRAFTEDERKGFDLDAIKHKPCQLNLIPSDKDRVKIGAVLPAARDGSGHIMQHWTPETPADYVPNFVQKMRDMQIVQTPKHGTAERLADDGFTDEIPF